MEPSDQAAYDRGEAVEPKAPVVFYIDTTFTAQMSAAITKGILEWNKCFEAIGFKNAIRVRPFPTPEEDPQFSPQNFRYNCINYVPSLTATPACAPTSIPAAARFSARRSWSATT